MRRNAKAVTAATAALLLTLALSATLASAVAPVVSVEDASNVSYTTADVKGTVNPEGQFTTWRFQYIADAQFQENLSNSLPGFEGANTPFEESTEAEETLERELMGLNPGTIYHLRLVAENGDGQSEAVATNTFTTDAVGPPSVTIDPVTTFDGTTAKFTGTIDPEAPEEGPGEFPEAFDVEWHFECMPACSDALSGKIEADSILHTVEADASDLEPNTSYEVRLVAKNTGGQISAGPESFKTDRVAPNIRPLYAALADEDSALIGGLVNPRNSAVSYQIEWGLDATYGNFTTATPEPLGSENNAFHAVTATIEGLAPNTTYHYRVVATNTEISATSLGEDRSFTTLEPAPLSPGLPEGRVYEKVSPQDKASSDIQAGTDYFEDVGHGIGRASPSGQAVTYWSFGSFAGGNGAGLKNQYLSSRSSAGWNTRGISLPRDPGSSINNTAYQIFTQDLTGIGLTTAAINPGDPKGTLNLYRFDRLTNTYTLLSPPAGPIPPSSGGKQYPVAVGASETGDHVVFQELGSRDFLPDPHSDFYEFSHGEMRDAAILPDGTPAVGCTGTTKGVFEEAASGTGYAMSDDGEYVYFSCGPAPGVYLREHGALTTPVGLSETTDASPQPMVSLLDTTPNGDTAFITSAGRLTDDSGGAGDLYRWAREAPPGSRLANLTPDLPSGAGVVRVLDVSTDGERVYFLASAALTPQATGGANNLYLWEEGQGTRLVATTLANESFFVLGQNFNDKDDPGNPAEYGYNGVEWRMTPNGRSLLFRSAARLTAYDTGDIRQLYLYDSVNDRIYCISCNPRTKVARKQGHLNYTMTGQVILGQNDYTQDWTRNISGDGRRIFFDSIDSLVPRDTNGKVDVYEWLGGRLHLISTGSSNRHSFFQDASASGDDVFFTTGEPIVRSDGDGLFDMYDARVGGKREPAPIPGCQGDECQGTPKAPPTFSNPSSSIHAGPGSRTPRKTRQKKRRKKVRNNRKQKRSSNRKAPHRRGRR